jgi:tol-pal system protein YbgF
MRKPVAWAAALSFGLIMAGAGLAQTTLDDSLDAHSAKRLDNMEKVVRELRAIVFQGRETGQPVVVQPADTQSQISALTDRVNDLDHTLTTLNGQMEVVRHDLDQSRADNGDLRGRIAALKEEVDALQQKLAVLSAPPPPPAALPAAPAPQAATPPDDPATDFAAARRLWQSGDATAAEAAFRDFSDRYSDNALAPEARYYLAKTLLARQAWAEAATADIGAIRGWPKTRWAPEAMLDLSRALAGIGKTSEACQTLDELPRRYPKPTPAVTRDMRALRAADRCE